MICHDDFRHGGHAHCIGTQNMEHLVFRRCFECGTLRTDIDTVLNLDALFCRNGVGLTNQLFVISFAHIREARTVRYVFATQWMFGEVVYMVGDNHQVTDRKIRICAATGIGNE